jgi:hypothetical protein
VHPVVLQGSSTNQEQGKKGQDQVQRPQDSQQEQQTSVEGQDIHDECHRGLVFCETR